MLICFHSFATSAYSWAVTSQSIVLSAGRSIISRPFRCLLRRISSHGFSPPLPGGA
jgi:hypothetical protein